MLMHIVACSNYFDLNKQWLRKVSKIALSVIPYDLTSQKSGVWDSVEGVKVRPFLFFQFVCTCVCAFSSCKGM